MEKAALRNTAFDAVIFTGELDDWYPEWVEDDVLNFVLTDNFTGQLYVIKDDGQPDDEFKRWDLTKHSVIIRNRYNEPYIVDPDVFDNLYVMIGRDRAARIEDCIDFYIHYAHIDIPDLPEPLQECVADGRLVFPNVYPNYSKYPWWREPGEPWVELSNEGVFIRNRKGDIKYIPNVNAFLELYEAPWPTFIR